MARLRDARGRFIKAGAGVTGVGKVIRNLAFSGKKIKAGLVIAVTESIINIQRNSMKFSPVHLGNLMGSHRNKVFVTPTKVAGIVWVTADYGLFVHEAPPTTKFRSAWPRGRKYMERAINTELVPMKSRLRKYLRVF